MSTPTGLGRGRVVLTESLGRWWAGQQNSGSDEVGERRVDLRLVPVAAVGWAAGGLGTWATGASWALAGASAVAVLVVAARRRSAWLAATALVIAVLTLLGGLQAHRLQTGPLAELARQGAVVTADLVVRGDPRMHPAQGSVPAYVTLDATLETVSGRDRSWRLRAPVLVVGSGAGVETFRTVVVGSRLQLDGRLQAPDRGSALAAVVRARGQPRLRQGPGRGAMAVERVREGLRTAVAGRRIEPRALVPALVLGDTSRVEPDLVADFQATGLTHLTAVSGVTNNWGYVYDESVRVIIYGRVSRDPRQLGRSVEEQVVECSAWAEREGWEIVRVVRETASASRYARVERRYWNEVLEVVSAGEVDALLTWENSRATRDLTAYTELRKVCVDSAVKWGYSGRLFDLAERDSRFRTGLDALLAEDEAARTSERILRSVRHAALAGRPHGKNLYGYRRVYDSATRQLIRIEPHPAQAPIVLEAARRVLEGDTLYAIAKSFNERGLLPRRVPVKEHRQRLGWTPVAIKQMLVQPSYAGVRTHNGEAVADASWPALIQQGDWDQIQAILHDPARGRMRNATAVHLLSGIAICEACGGQMRVGLQNEGRAVIAADGAKVQSKYRVYVCQGTPGKGGFHTAIKCAFLDDLVTEAVISRLERPDAVDLLGATDGDSHADERKRLRLEIEGCRTWLEQVRQRAMRERNLDLLFDQEARTQPLIDAAQRKLNRLTDLDPSVSDLVRSEDPRDRWAELPLDTQRRIIHALVQPRVSRAEHRGQRSVESILKRVELQWR